MRFWVTTELMREFSLLVREVYQDLRGIGCTDRQILWVARELAEQIAGQIAEQSPARPATLFASMGSFPQYDLSLLGFVNEF